MKIHFECNCESHIATIPTAPVRKTEPAFQDHRVDREKDLKKLKRQLDFAPYSNAEFKDRAEARRERMIKVEHVDPLPESSAIPYEPNSTGLDLMKKMGWKAGKGLGVEENGIVEPIETRKHHGTRGLGA